MHQTRPEPRRGRPPLEGETMVQISIRLPLEQLAWIDKRARRLGISRNHAIREVIYECAAEE